MSVLIPLIIVWGVAIGGIFVMHKIQPSIAYPIWAVSIAVLFTLFVISYVSQV